jgi:hypothetical protein
MNMPLKIAQARSLPVREDAGFRGVGVALALVEDDAVTRLAYLDPGRILWALLVDQISPELALDMDDECIECYDPAIDIKAVQAVFDTYQKDIGHLYIGLATADGRLIVDHGPVAPQSTKEICRRLSWGYTVEPPGLPSDGEEDEESYWLAVRGENGFVWTTMTEVEDFRDPEGMRLSLEDGIPFIPGEVDFLYWLMGSVGTEQALDVLAAVRFSYEGWMPSQRPPEEMYFLWMNPFDEKVTAIPGRTVPHLGQLEHRKGLTECVVVGLNPDKTADIVLLGDAPIEGLHDPTEDGVLPAFVLFRVPAGKVMAIGR